MTQSKVFDFRWDSCSVLHFRIIMVFIHPVSTGQNSSRLKKKHHEGEEEIDGGELDNDVISLTEMLAELHHQPSKHAST